VCKCSGMNDAPVTGVTCVRIFACMLHCEKRYYAVCLFHELKLHFTKFWQSKASPGVYRSTWSRREIRDSLTCSVMLLDLRKTINGSTSTRSGSKDHEQNVDAPLIIPPSLVNIFILFPVQENAQQKCTRIVKRNIL